MHCENWITFVWYLTIISGKRIIFLFRCWLNIVFSNQKGILLHIGMKINFTHTLTGEAATGSLFSHSLPNNGQLGWWLVWVEEKNIGVSCISEKPRATKGIAEGRRCIWRTVLFSCPTLYFACLTCLVCKLQTWTDTCCFGILLSRNRCSWEVLEWPWTWAGAVIRSAR